MFLTSPDSPLHQKVLSWLGMKAHILLVDDETSILLTLKAILEMSGFEVDTASSAHEAIQKLEGGVFHIVITDMRMETEDAGFKVVSAAREQSYEPATAILTAYPALGTDWKSRGAQALLVKPLDTKDLLRQIDALLAQHEYRKLATRAADKSLRRH